MQKLHGQAKSWGHHSGGALKLPPVEAGRTESQHLGTGKCSRGLRTVLAAHCPVLDSGASWICASGDARSGSLHLQMRGIGPVANEDALARFLVFGAP